MRGGEERKKNRCGKYRGWVWNEAFETGSRGSQCRNVYILSLLENEFGIEPEIMPTHCDFFKFFYVNKKEKKKKKILTFWTVS